MSVDHSVRTGRCLCGGVRYRVSGEMRNVINCFCEQCRRTSGHHVAASAAQLDGFELESETTLEWYESSDTARRGFCRRCGSSLFWQQKGRDNISIFAGTLDQPTGLRTVKIYTATVKATTMRCPN